MKRRSGVLMHISSLWGEYSCGAFGEECFEFIDFLAQSGFSVWQVLPFCVPDECNSPYKSYSAFSLNPFFIDLKTLNKQGLITDSELAAAKQKSPYSCEFERLKTERLSLLSKAASRFDDKAAISEFLKNHPNTADFCKFMALKKVNNELSWNDWTEKTPDDNTLYLWQFTQYIFYTQWMEIKKYANSKNILIVGDIPIYVSHDSSDVWANPKQFMLDEKNLPVCVAGVPPDYFCPDGQLWGNPLYDWDKMKDDDYSWWRARLEFMNELFDGIRIDHFRGLDSYYAVSADENTAKNGLWKKGPGMDFINVIKKVCSKKFIIAEDLGDITEDVEKLVKDSGFPGMCVLQFGFLGDSSSPHLPHNYKDNCVAYTGTHDNNTLLGYVWELDEITRQRLFDYVDFSGDDWNSCYPKIIKMMLRSHANTVIMPIQDLLFYGSDTRFNTPGKSDGNWAFRITKGQLDSINKQNFMDQNILFGRV